MSSIGYALRKRERERREGGESDGTFVKITDDMSSIVDPQRED